MPLLEILLLGGGYNTSLVMLGVAMLGAAGGAAGTFALLRKRALVSDGMSHATLPGIAFAFLLGHALWGEGRSFWLLMSGAALAALLGLWFIALITRHTRLEEDAAIGIVLSSFFGLGIVLFTVIQATNLEGQAGLNGYLLGSTAGMISTEAEAIALAAAASAAIVALAFRAFAAIAFDEGHAAALGLPVRALDFLLMGLVLTIVVIGLKAVGLILVIALLITPAVAARFWTDNIPVMAVLAAAIGAAGAYFGAAVSALAPALPTGALIVLTQFAILLLSLLVSPRRGFIAMAVRHALLQRAVHERQGLLQIARGEPVFDAYTLRILIKRGFMRRDGEPTQAGREAGALAYRDQALWRQFRLTYPAQALALDSWALKPIEAVLPADAVAELERRCRGDGHAGRGRLIQGGVA